ncbi:Hypp3773 [Branchiostoma lanceolatum]|nr:Hypp3773 [Branchiostoma lanceolatum]
MDVVIEDQDEDRGVLEKAGFSEPDQDPCTLKRVAPSEFNNDLVVKLRKLHGRVTNHMVAQLKSLAPFELLPDIDDCKDTSLRSKAEKVWKEFQDKNRHFRGKDREAKLTEFKNTPFELPRSRAQPSEVPTASTSATQSKLNQARKDLKNYKRRCAQAEHENAEQEERYEWLTEQYFSALSELQASSEDFQKVIQEKSSCAADLSKDLAEANKRNAELRAKLDSLRVRMAKRDTIRNANKKLKRRDNNIEKKDETIQELQTAVRANNEEVDELREAKVKAEEEQVRAEEKVSGLQKKVKCLQDGRRKLELKLKKQQDNKLEMEADLETTVSELNKKLEELQKENTDLQQIQALLESETVKTFEDGKYRNDVREVVMDLLTSGVSMSKVDTVITSVLQRLAGLTVDRLPSMGLKSQLLLEARILAQTQVAEAIVAGGGQPELGNCLHQDGTSKFFKKYQTFDVTLPSGRTLTMSMSEVPSGTAAGITSSFTEACKELAEVLCTKREDVAEKTAQIVASFTSTMSDRGATNPLFNQELEELRRELLPVAEKNWDTFSDEVKDELTNVSNFFCKMHLLVNWASEANSTLKLFEDAVAQGKNPFAFSQAGEAGATRLIRTACSAFTDHGNEKSGTPHYFNSHLSHHHNEEKNYMVTFRGNRFNILFYNAAAVYHHHKHIINFVSSWPDPNGLLKAVKADASQKVYLAGVRALGMVDKTITGPFFRLLGTQKGILDLNPHLHQMQLSLDRWSKDASSMMEGEALFDEEVVKRNKDALYQSLFAASEDEELDVLTQQALEVICASMLILLERQAEEQLPGGRFWEPTEAERQKSQHVPTTNVVSERDFAVLDNLLRAKPYATSLSFEAYIMWLNNQTSTWLKNLSAEDKERHMTYARTHASSVREKFQEKKKQIKEQRLQTLLEKQRVKEEKLKRARAKKVALADKVMQIGGVWKSPEEVEEQMEAMSSEQVKLDALKCQLQFHKQVLGSQGEKEHFQMTVTKPGKKKHTFTSSEKVEHLKEVLRNNISTTTSFESGSEEEEEDTEYVKLKEPDMRSVQDVRTKLNSKLQNQREKMEITRQKLSLPEYLKDPSKLAGCRVKHKFVVGDDVKWYDGKVTHIVERTEDTKDTKYYIVYDEEDEPDETFPLLVDMGKGDLKVL